MSLSASEYFAYHRRRGAPGSPLDEANDDAHTPPPQSPPIDLHTILSSPDVRRHGSASAARAYHALASRFSDDDNNVSPHPLAGVIPQRHQVRFAALEEAAERRRRRQEERRMGGPRSRRRRRFINDRLGHASDVDFAQSEVDTSDEEIPVRNSEWTAAFVTAGEEFFEPNSKLVMERFLKRRERRKRRKDKRVLRRLRKAHAQLLQVQSGMQQEPEEPEEPEQPDEPVDADAVMLEIYPQEENNNSNSSDDSNRDDDEQPASLLGEGMLNPAEYHPDTTIYAHPAELFRSIPRRTRSGLRKMFTHDCVRALEEVIIAFKHERMDASTIVSTVEPQSDKYAFIDAPTPATAKRAGGSKRSGKRKTKAKPQKPKRAPLHIVIDDSFYRSLFHGLATFHGLVSSSVTDKHGRRVTVLRATKLPPHPYTVVGFLSGMYCQAP